MRTSILFGKKCQDKIIVTDLPANEAIKAQGYAAVPGGIMIQLPSSIGTTDIPTSVFPDKYFRFCLKTPEWNKPAR